MSKADNPPAFPKPAFQAPGDRQYDPGQSGMSLRDWFAGQALASIMQDRAIWDSTQDEEHEIASRMYRWADAMLAERKKVQP